jgi:Chaperone of endosialidase
MPRDIGTGIYYYPSGTQGNSGQTIFSARYNTFINDLTNTLNQPLPTNMGGTGADNPSTARTNLKAEAAGQQVTNYDAHVFEAGSFWSAIGATSAPNGINRFVGTCIIITDATNDIFIEATTPGTPNPVYTRRKNGGSWGAWVQQPGSAAELDAAYVNLTGDTMTGGLTVPTINLNATNLFISDGTNNIIRSNGQVYVQTASGGALNTLNVGNLTAGGSVTTGGGITCNGNIATNAISCSTLTTNGNTITCGNLNSSGTVTATNIICTTNDALRATVPAGNNARLRTTVTGVREWSTGTAASAAYMIADESAGAVRLSIDTAGTANFQGNAVYAGSFNGTLNGNVNGSSSSCTGNAATATTAATANNVNVSPGGSGTGSIIEGPYAIDFLHPGHTGDYNARIIVEADHSLSFWAAYYTFNGGRIVAPDYKSRSAVNSWHFNWTGTLEAIIDGGSWGSVLNIHSDYRMKKDVTDLPGMWDTVKALRPVKYTGADWAPYSTSDSVERWGFIAHELQETMIPAASTGTKDGEGAPQQPHWPVVVAALTKALQEAMARIEALEAAA